MKRLNDYRMRLVIVGVAVAIVASGGQMAIADFVTCDPMPVDEAINSPGAGNPGGCCFLHDGLKLYFTSGRDPSNTNSRELWVAERESPDAPWGEAVNLGPNINQPTANETSPAISPDDLELYFQQYRYSDGYYWMRSTRASIDEPWGPATDFTGLGDAGIDFASDGLTVYFSSRGAGGYGDRDIWVATRATTDDEWGEPVNLGPNVNDSGGQLHPSISSDGLALFFLDWTTHRIFMCIRATTDDGWGPAIDLGPAVNAQRVSGPEISPDGSTLYFSSTGLYCQASIKPVVDFDEDGNVGMSDLLAMIGYWGTDEPLCDIGPMPWGDGVVDEADLEVLMNHWGESSPIYVVVDDFESYTNSWETAGTVFHTWLDGMGYGDEPAPGYFGNGTGSTVVMSILHMQNRPSFTEAINRCPCGMTTTGRCTRVLNGKRWGCRSTRKRSVCGRSPRIGLRTPKFCRCGSTAILAMPSSRSMWPWKTAPATAKRSHTRILLRSRWNVGSNGLSP